jgi:serine/threonine-protein kinase
MVIDPMDIAEGRTISHYRVLSRLGGGGMGVVYKAQDVRLSRFVSLKFLPAALTDDTDARTRLVREAQTLSALDHPNICSVYEIDETPDGRTFISMAFYDGETLDQRLARGPLPVDEALAIVARVADGLSRAHDHDIIHRDITPGNIMLTAQGDVKILDFGLAKLRNTTRVTGEGTVMGTCAYMSPEQTRGEEVDARSDIFSLGVVLYELLAGRRPFDADHPDAILDQIRNAEPKPLTRVVPKMRPELQRIIDKALQKNVATRYAKISEMRDDVRSVAAGEKPAWAKLPRRYARLVGLLAIAGAITAVVAFNPTVNNAFKRMISGVPAEMHVAVLPFENVGNDPMNQAFCDGLMETLSTQLTHLEQARGTLWVVPASEVRAVKVASPTDARKTLGVNLVVTGSVQRFGDRFRVTMNIVDPTRGSTPRQLKSQMFDNRTDNMSILQDEAVMWIADTMQLTLLPQEKQVLVASRTEVSGAYDDYLRGLGYVRSYEVEGNLDRAIGAFSSALAHDSLYALAYAGLGEAYWRKYKDTTDPQWIPPALKNGTRAVALDTLLAPAHVTLGMILGGTGKPERAVTEFQRAIELEPKNVLAYRSLAAAYAAMDRIADAEATYQRSIDMKPDYWGGYNDYGNFNYARGEYEKAAAHYQKVIELTPDNKFGYNNLGACYWGLGKTDKAREMFERSIAIEPNFRAYSNLGALYYMAGEYARSADMCLEARKLNDVSYKTWANLANAYYFVPGKRDEAMATYRRAAELAEDQRRLTPKDANLLSSLAGYYAVLGDKDRAQSLVRESLEIAPRNSRVLYFDGHACEQLGQRDEAVALIGTAIDNGYPMDEVEKDPWLEQLREDSRFDALKERGRVAELKRAQEEKK